MRARLIGKTWITTADEVERYRGANLGRPGRTAPINPMLVRAYVAYDPVAGRSPAWLITYEQEAFVIDPGGGNQAPFNWAGQPAMEPIPSRARGDPLKPGLDVLTREQVEAALLLDLDVARQDYVGFPEPAVIFRAGPIWNAQKFELWRAIAQMRPPTEWSRSTP